MAKHKKYSIKPLSPQRVDNLERLRQEQKKLEKERRRFDMAVSVNTFADVHRVLMDRIDGDLKGAETSALTPAEIARRCVVAVVQDMADDVAELWRDYTPDANNWDEDETGENARQFTLLEVSDDLRRTYDKGKANVCNELFAAFSAEGVSVTEDQLRLLITLGVEQGWSLVDEAIDQVREDRPATSHLWATRHIMSESGDAAALRAEVAAKNEQIDQVQSSALVESWNRVAQLMTECLPKDAHFPDTSAGLFYLACLQTCQQAVAEVFNDLISPAPPQPGEEPIMPYRFAGRILTRMGIPQEYCENQGMLGELQEARAARDDEDWDNLPPLPMNGQVAETPEGLAVRELEWAIDTLQGNLQNPKGIMRKRCIQAFRELVEQAPAMRADKRYCASLEELAMWGGGLAVRSDYIVSRPDQDTAFFQAFNMLGEVKTCLGAYRQELCGWTSPADHLTADPETGVQPRVTVMPACPVVQ